LVSYRELALSFFGRPLARHLELAERELALTEILYDGEGRTVIDIGGDLQADSDSELTDEVVLRLGARAAAYSGQVLSENSPSISVVVPPDWRVTILRSPVVEFPIMAMRKLRRVPIPLSSWVMHDEIGALTDSAATAAVPRPSGMREQLRWLAEQRKTVAISGEVGSGKTSLLRAMLSMVPLHERIVTIEDPRELMLTEGDGTTTRRRNYVALEAKPKVREMDALLRDALRLRPDRIIIGEVRGPEALELVRSLNVGHQGSMFTVHSKGRKDALDRLHSLTTEAQDGFRFDSVERAIDAVVQITGRGASRMIAEIWP
jgi:type IV secretory pathway ATPase VirB11/archaellum biosynthesis ATPase